MNEGTVDSKTMREDVFCLGAMNNFCLFFLLCNIYLNYKHARCPFIPNGSLPSFN